MGKKGYVMKVALQVRKVNKILAKKGIAPEIKLVEISAPEIAKKAKPGQFVIVRVWKKKAYLDQRLRVPNGSKRCGHSDWTDPDPPIKITTPRLEVTRHGTIVVNKKMQTSLEGVYAGGDIVSGAASVISAVGAGKKAARSIHEYVMRNEMKRYDENRY